MLIIMHHHRDRPDALVDLIHQILSVTWVALPDNQTAQCRTGHLGNYIMSTLCRARGIIELTMNTKITQTLILLLTACKERNVVAYTQVVKDQCATPSVFPKRFAEALRVLPTLESIRRGFQPMDPPVLLWHMSQHGRSC